jgi:predicted nucleic acid-binding protein
MYLDSCIIVKLLVVEPDSEFFIHSLAGKSLVSSELSRTEVFSALLARERGGKISTTERRRAWREFEKRIADEEIRLEPLDTIVLRKAVYLLERSHPQVALRTLDAIHLATADLLQDFPLVTTDGRLRDAATLSNFQIFPTAEKAD